jgi:aspartate carbamoyltransferase catalytic subunit
MKMRHLLDTTDLSLDEIDDIISLATDIISNPKKYAHVCDGKKLATLFFEPSTRTRLSFEAAMYELGGNVIGFSEASSTSASKGETVEDTVRIVSNYADIIAMRHPLEGAPRVAVTKTLVPIINAGDGGHAHPTQTLADLLTFYREKGRLDNLTIGLCGDLKFGRTVHSLIKAMCRYKNIKFVLIAPNELQVPDYIIKDVLEPSGTKYVQVESMDAVMPDLDVLYMTRIQRERFFSAEEYLKYENAFILDLDKLENAKSDLTIMHPLPRVNEIATNVDDDPRAKYFEQALNGKYVRMALIMTLLKWGGQLEY